MSFLQDATARTLAPKGSGMVWAPELWHTPSEGRWDRFPRSSLRLPLQPEMKTWLKTPSHPTQTHTHLNAILFGAASLICTTCSGVTFPFPSANISAFILFKTARFVFYDNKGTVSGAVFHPDWCENVGESVSSSKRHKEVQRDAEVSRYDTCSYHPFLS